MEERDGGGRELGQAWRHNDLGLALAQRPLLRQAPHARDADAGQCEDRALSTLLLARAFSRALPSIYVADIYACICVSLYGQLCR